MKKKGLITLVAVIAVLGLIIGIFAGTYNKLVDRQGQVEGAYAEIETQLQRRADLIQNFVNTVKGASDYEQSTLTAVTQARNAVSSAQNAEDLSVADEQLTKAFSVWVNAVTEAYPELKATENYTALQDELAGTENRIAKARNNYNEAAKEYNVAIKKFPRNIVAGMFGFEKVDYFEAASGSENAPVVSFE